MSGHLTPYLQECTARLGAWMPFEPVRAIMTDMLGVRVSEPTIRRQTEAWGAAHEAVQWAEVERLERELPAPPIGPDKLLLSVDGAMVPLVKGEWTEAKTLVLGVIEEPVWEKDAWVVHASELSYFSRMMEAEAFARASLVETQRRGVETARVVAAITDGAEWEQGYIDYHREDAIRVLDFPHAAEHVSDLGSAVWGVGTDTTQAWLKDQLHRLKHEGPTQMLAVLRTLVQEHPDLSDLPGLLAYLETREAHMQYPTYQVQGLPIGSGAVESGNKVVVEARLKGAGMHWARSHVNPMLALRNAVCNNRWAEASAQVLTYRHQQAVRRRQARREQRWADRAAASVSAEVAPGPQLAESTAESPVSAPVPLVDSHVVNARDPVVPRVPWKPGPDHPWRRSLFGKARYRQRSHDSPAKN